MPPKRQPVRPPQRPQTVLVGAVSVPFTRIEEAVHSHLGRQYQECALDKGKAEVPHDRLAGRSPTVRRVDPSTPITMVQNSVSVLLKTASFTQ